MQIRNVSILNQNVSNMDTFWFNLAQKWGRLSNNLPKKWGRLSNKNRWSYSQNPAHTKKRGMYLQNPTAGLQTYWARGAQVLQQFAAVTTSKMKTHLKMKMTSISLLIQKLLLEKSCKILMTPRSENFNWMATGYAHSRRTNKKLDK